MIKWVPNKEINKIKIDSLLQESINQNQFTNYGPCVKLLEDPVDCPFKLNKLSFILN